MLSPERQKRQHAEATNRDSLAFVLPGCCPGRLEQILIMEKVVKNELEEELPEDLRMVR